MALCRKVTTMKKLSLLSLLAAGAMISQSSYAQPSFPMTYIGQLAVQKIGGPPLNCDFEVIFLSTTAVDVNNTSPAWPCNTFSIDSNSHSYTYDHVTKELEIFGFEVSTTLTEGNCHGDLAAYKDGGVIVITEAELEGGYVGSVKTGNCLVDGALERD